MAILLATGISDSRDTHLPLALAILDGIPVVAIAVAELRLAPLLETSEVVVVAPSGAVAEMRSALREHGLHGFVTVVEGGASRDASLHSALLHLQSLAGVAHDDDPVIVVHDAARPLSSAALIQRVVAASIARMGSPVVPVLAMTETVKRIDHSGKIVETIPRESVVRVQMPQASSLSRLNRLHANCVSTDNEAVFLVDVGAETELVSGDESAMPVRTAKDRELASALRRRRLFRERDPAAD